MSLSYTFQPSANVAGITLACLFFLSACSSDRGPGDGRRKQRQNANEEGASSQKRTEVYGAVKDAVWMVYTHNAGGGGAQGLAFMTDPSGVLLTNYGLIADEYGEVDPVGLTLENAVGRQFVVSQILLRSAEHDYATLRIRPRVGETFPAVRISATEPQIGDRCYAISSPAGTADSIVEGTVSGYRDGRDFIKTTLTTDRASSGGPLLNGVGEVIGLTTGATGSSGLALNIRHIPLPAAGRVAVIPRGRRSRESENPSNAARPAGGGEKENEPAVQRRANRDVNGSDVSPVIERKRAAGPRLEDLPATAVGEGEHRRVKKVVEEYFAAARRADYAAMEAALAPVVNRFFSRRNISREAAIASSREYDLKNSARVLEMDLHWEQSAIRALPDGYICTIPMDYSVSFRGAPKSFRLAMTIGLSEDFKINYIAEKILSRQDQG